jgi:hypothetical protein
MAGRWFLTQTFEDLEPVKNKQADIYQVIDEDPAQASDKEEIC